MTIRFIRNFLLLALFSFTLEVAAQCGNSGFIISSPRCMGQPVLFVDTTSSTADSTLWRFSSGGATVNNDSTQKTYGAAGSDTVWMYRFYTSPDTCVDTVFAVYTITDPTVTVTPSPVNICVGDSATLTAASGAGLTYQWMLNGSDISGQTGSTLRVGANGVYSIRASGNGCVDTSNAVTVTIYNYPNANFIFGPDSACSGTTVNFINTSTGTSLSHSWQFGNAGTSTIANPNFVFDTSGTRSIVSYQVRLITSTPGNCTDTITKTVYVRRKPFPGLGDFNNVPPFIQCNVGSFPFVLQMDNTSTTKTTDATYSINWGDGSSQNFTAPFDTVTHVFATSGLFVVQITATDSAGCPNTRTVNVFNGGNPGVSLGNSGSTSGCTPYSLNFTIDTSKVTGVGNNADGTTYTFNFNDGSAPVTFTHPPPPIYNKIFSIPSCGVATPGFNNAFQVELVVSNPCGNNSSTIRPIYISTKPVAQIGIQPDGDTVCEDVPFIIYDDSDTGSVSSGSGCNETPRRLWDIFPTTGWTLQSGYFGNHSNWNNNPANWGSGSLQVAFNDTGTYTVRLIVGNIAQAGVSVCGDDTIERIIRVFRLPVANFTLNLNPVSGCVNSTITTNNTSTGDQLSYEWQVSPNSGYTLSSGTLTSANPTFVFNTPGTYIVSLIASNRCSVDTAQDTIVMKGVPTATLPGAQQYCGPQVISFADLVANTAHRPTYNTNFGDTITYQWTVTGGGYTYTSGDSTSSNPSISLNDAGTYTVQVRITNECGTDTATQVITIHPLPVADYTVNDTDQCINGNSFVFTNTTSISSGSITSYNWNFGQAPTSTLTNPTKTYTSTGTFNVRLIAVSDQGCRDTIIKQMRVYPKPTPNYTINDTDQCINGNNFIFTNTSTIAGGGTNTFLWTFTNRANDTSTQTSPTKVYDTVGNFSVKLVVTSNNGCKDSVTKTLRVYPKPTPSFTVNDTDQCLNGNSFQFTNTSSISSGTITYTWKFGSSAADSSNATNPTKVYTTEGNYTVKLIARSNNGCRDSVTGPVYVYPKPNVTYAVNDSDQCFTGNSFVFTNNSTISSGTVSYLWKFSNTATDTSTQTSPTKVYTSTGVFPVKLEGTSDHGCIDSITRNMTVYPEPRAGFSVNDTDQCLNGNNFAFTDTSVVGGAYSRSWTFGDGGTSTANNPSHSYASVNTFNVKLVVTITAGGCKDSATRPVYTYPAPVPAFTVDDSIQCFPGHLFTFTNGSTISSGTNTYLWKFDAPSATDTSTATNPTKTYGTAGTYIVRLIATSDKGCIDSAQHNVFPEPPVLNNVISANQGICSGFAPDTLRQSGAAVAGGNGSFTYSWYESSDSVSWSQLAGIATSYFKPPVLNATIWYRRVIVSGPCSDTSAPVKITVTPAITNNTISANQTVCEGFAPAAFGGSTPSGGLGVYTFQWQQSTDSSNWSSISGADDTTYQEGALAVTTWYRRNITSGVCTIPSNVVKVQVNPKPSVSFNTASVCFGFNASYTSTSTVASGSITSYSWNFGDGNTGTGSSQTHGYAATGSYTIKLIATTDSSCKDSTTRTIWVNPKPVAAYTSNDTCLGFANNFNASGSSVASGSVIAYNWNFGDATNGIGATVSKTYSAHGSYNAKLIVTTDSACKDSVTHTVTVHPRPVPNFTINDSDQCLSGNNFVYTNTSSIASGSSTYLWTLGEGTSDTSTLASPAKTYAANGNYNVRVRATSNFGCIDSITKPVIVYSMPAPGFSINDSDQCLEGNTFVFNNTSSISPIVTLNYVWRFGDGSTSSTASPNKSYAAEGTYPVRLVVTSANNCKDSIQKNVYVRPMPDASFTINDTLQCYSSNLFVYTNTSTISSGTITNFWRLNLAAPTDTSTQTSVNKTYTVSGSLSVRLTVTSDYQCKDSVQRNIIVRPDITFNNIAPGQDICAGQVPNQVAHSGVPLNGGDGTFAYQWQQSIDSASWANIGGATGAAYQPGALFDTTWYRRIVFSGPCSDTSAPVRIGVTPGITNNTISASQVQCGGFAPNRFNGSLPTGGSGAYSYQWQFSLDSTSWTDITSANDTNYQAGVLTQTTWFRRGATSGTCTVYSTPVKVTVNPKPVASFTTASVCFGFNASYTSTSTVATGSITQYSWIFGDSATATGNFVQHNYAAFGTYTTKLIVTTDSGCKDSATRVMRVHPKPVAAYTYNDTCHNDAHSFNATGSTVALGNITNYSWDFNDATTATGSTATKTYASVGTYNVKLVVTSDSACKDSITKAVIVHPNPVPGFTVNDSDQCVNGNNFAFTNATTIASGSSTYRWNFGESTTDTSASASPSKVYAARGSYNVRLVATSNFGCKDSATKTMIVYAKPAQAFSINDTDQCVNGNNFTFTNGSAINPVEGLTYFWTFGNGDTSTQTNTTKVYASAGTYPVKLRVTSANGCVDSITKNVYVYPKPTPDFTINDTLQCFGPNVFTYTNASSISSGTMTHFWKFNLSQANDTSSVTSPSKTYSGAGTYTVRLTVTSDHQCKDSIQKQVTVKPDIVNNTISTPQFICQNDTPDTLRQTAGTVSGGNNTFTYQWQESTDSSNWSNIGSATGVNYAPPALSVTTWYRRIITSGPCLDTSNVVKVKVTPAIGNNVVTANQAICEGLAPAKFIGTLPTGGNGIFAYQWQISTDSTSWSDISSATDTFYQSGALTQKRYYRRRVTSGSCTVISTPIRVIVNPKPSASFNTASVCFGFNAGFTSTSTVSSGSFTDYGWYFGDSTIAGGSSVQHNYAAFGTYTVKLIVVTTEGCKDSTTRTLRIHPKPVAAYTYNDTCHDDAHTFNATGSTVALGSITGYGWNFGDATTATGSTTTKTYASVGSYNVKLIVTSDSACKDSITKTVVVHPNPVPAFTVNDSDQCVNGNNFAFTNGSTISSGSNTYLWNFGVNTADTSNAANPNKVYAANGNYNVKLVAISNFGCKDSTTRQMIVYAKPAQAFSINDTDQCLTGNNFVFTNNSNISPAVGLTYLWTFGNGDTSTQTNPTKAYAVPGTYPVKLKVTSIFNCVDSVTKNMYVYPMPTANFTINDTLQCFAPNSFTFTNTSTISAGTLTHFWRFNLLSANDTSNVTSPTKTYNTYGNYTVRLRATSDKGCKDSIEKQVTVNQDIVNNAIATNQFICQNEVPDTLRQASGSVSGGNASFTYQWQQSTDSINYTNISSATADRYGPPALSVTTWYRRIITSGPCMDTSNVVRVHVTPAIGNNVITANQSICEGFAPAKFNGALPTGGNGIYAYQWQISSDSSSWSNISGGTDTSYQSGVLTQTRFYRRSVTSGSCSVISPPIKVIVNPKPAASFNTASVCFGFNAGFNSTSSVASGNITSYSWNFGDGNTGAGSSQTHNYASAGSYTIKLIVTTDSACKDSTTHTVRVHPKPVAAYVFNDTCHNKAHSFNASGSTVATGSIAAYSWNFGDATTANGVTAAKTYTSVGSYNVKLVVTTDSSCTDSITKTVTVHPNPVAGFTVNDSDQCVNGNNFVFTNGSGISSGTNTYRWNLGESTADTSVATNPASKVYASNGSYTVKLVATSNFGCKDSITKQTVVYAKPAQAFSINDTDQCINGNNFIFTNNSTISPAAGLSYSWTFGNGDTSTVTNPTKVYAAAGTYTVKLKVTSVNNCSDSVSKTVYVYPKPAPDFTINDTLQCFNPNNFTFTNASSISSGTLAYFWRFNVLSASDTSNLTSPTKIYSTFGTFTVRLRATSDKGCKDSIEKQVTVKPGISNNAISASQFICQNSVPDTIRQASGSVSGGNGTYTYRWQHSTDSVNWTDIGSATTDKYAPPALSATTWYRRITTSLACMDTSNVVRVHVTSAIGNNSITASQSICEGFAPAKFNGTLPTGGNGTFAYQWQHSSDSTSWTNITGGTDTSYQAVALTQSRFYRRSVTSGACAVISPPIKVTVNPKPSASFNTASVCFGFDAGFTSTSLVSSGTLTSYTWKFGDGNNGSGSATTHNYAAYGTYTARLIVTSDSGCQDSTTRVLRVHPKPVAAYTYNDTCHTKTHGFNAVGSTVALGSITGYSWSFGDATSASGVTTTKTYATVASYSVRLIVTTDSACQDSITKTVVVHPNPVPAFTVNDSDQCVNGNNFAFTNGSTISSGSNTYRWNFGVNTVDTSNAVNPNKVYPANGNYNVRLVATSNFGCKDSTTKQMIVYAKPAQAFSINDTDQCVNGNSFVFTNNSTITPAVGLTYSWAFGNGDTSNQTNPTKVYTTPGTYAVKLKVTSVQGCNDSVTKNIYVYPKPSPDFTINDTVQCFGPNSFVFTNTSNISSGTLTYFWRFNVLSATDTSNQANPGKTYNTSGTFTVRLRATSDKGCKDSIEKQVTVKPNIVNNAITAPQFICQNSVPDTLRQTSGSVSGGSNTYTFQWQQSTDSVNWTSISGATANRYGPPALSVTTWYRRIITSGPCMDTSNVVKVHVTPSIVNNIITSPQVICYAQTPAQLTSGSPSGGNGTYSYLWQQSADTTTWSSATNTNTSQQYQPPSLTDTTYYRRRMISGVCTTFSNILKIAVKPLPVVRFNNTTECFPNLTQFTDTSSVNQGTNVAWNWTFGDNGTSSQQNPSHQYAAGTYTAKLVVTTNFGCKDSLSKSITTHPKPKAGFSSPDICLGFTSSFTDTTKVGTGSITNWAWTFDDGYFSATQSPTHTYNTHGTYNVRLIVTTDRNCKDTVVKPLVVSPKPVAKYGVSIECFPNATKFTDSSTVATGTIASYAWTFGDGNGSAATNPTNSYASAGSYVSKLIITTDKNCKDSTTRGITVHPLPVVGFNGDTLECINRSVFYSNTSTGAFFYKWNYGDGDTSNGTVGSNIFDNPGYYRVSLIARTVYGCIDSAFKTVHIVTPPNPVFGLLPDSGCAPLNVNFVNTSTGDFTNYNWDFGNGQSSNNYSPNPVTFQQSLAGDTLYRIHLKATNLCGTRDAYDTVKVFPRPVANFGPDATSGCTPKTFSFTNTSSGFPQTYFWDFGNGNTSSADNPPPQLYTTDSVIKTFTIRLRVVNSCGTDTISRNVTVLPKNAKSLFGVDTLVGCPPLRINITDFSKGATLVSYDLGDGNTSNLRNPSHTYTDTGVFTIRQFITNTCTFDTSKLQIRVLPVPPVSFSEVPSNQCSGQDIQFVPNSPGATGFKWEFGTGDTSVLNSPKYKYPAPGLYTVRLSIVSGLNNCRNSTQDTIRINPLPVPQLTTDKVDGCPVLSVQFTNTTPNTSFITWKFGDGNSSSVINPVHQYTNTGAYLAWMIINANNGCVDSVSRLITVHPVPVASFTHNSTYCDVPVTVNFSNTSTGATTYNWDFGNSTTSSVTNPTVQYTALGVYNPFLVATNQFGCQDTARGTFEINRKPEPKFSIDTAAGCPPLTVQFRDTSQFGTSWFWDFADGFTSTAKNPQHTFNTSGNYNVKLKVTAGGNCSDSITLGSPIQVYPAAVAGFSHNFDPNTNNYGTVLFTDQSQNASKYFWEFGNGATSDQANPSIRYEIVGKYFVRQIIETDKGCKDTADDLIDLPFFGGLFVPNAFTPGLGGSEVSIFKPVAVSLKTYRLAIYDAWGKLLWQTELLQDTKPVEGWDGKYQGKDCAQDVYVWRIDATYLDGSPWPGMKGPDGKYHREGTVTLLR